MAEVLDITDAGELQDILSTESAVVVKFTAPAWCSPCMKFAPHFKATAERFDDVTFVSVDIDNAEWAAVDYGIQGVPTVMFYRNGEYVKNLQERTALKLSAEIKEA